MLECSTAMSNRCPWNGFGSFTGTTTISRVHGKSVVHETEKGLPSNQPCQLSSEPVDCQQPQDQPAPPWIAPQARSALDGLWLRQNRNFPHDFLQAVHTCAGPMSDAGDLAQDFGVDGLALLLNLGPCDGKDG